MYDYEIKLIDDGRAATVEVFNSHSGLTMERKVFCGSFKMLRACRWALATCKAFEGKYTGRTGAVLERR